MAGGKLSGLSLPRVLDLAKHSTMYDEETMPLTTFTVRVDAAVGRRLEELAKSTGRSRSLLAAEAIGEYLEANEWQVAGIEHAIASLDRGEGIAHKQIEEWVASWGRDKERPTPKRSTR